MTLTEFLLARIAEDEAVATNTGGRHEGVCWSAWGGEDAPETMWFRSRWDTARVLAECEAKRRLIATCARMAPYNREFSDALCEFAAVYADHPDYRDEWAA